MNREIKFRGKALNREKWFYGSLINNGYPLFCDIVRFNDDNEAIYEPVDINTIGQYTGLHDKNGKEIYEGDIMGFPEQDFNGVKCMNRFIRVVEWINDGFSLITNCMNGEEILYKYGDRLALEISLNLDYVVIGNIYDNPILPKGGEQ